MTEPIFQSLTMEHLDNVMEIERLCFKNPWSRFAFIHEIEFENSVFEVMFLEGRLIGYGGFWHILDEAHIPNIAVHPEYQRRNLGRRLLVHLMEMAVEKGATKATLEVRPSNMAAQRLYESFGFKTIAIRKNYYSDEGEDALVMWNSDIPAALESVRQKKA